MKTNLYLDIDNIINWYMMHVNHNLSKDLINHLIDLGILKLYKNNTYSLDELNSLMLQRHNNEYIKNSNNEYLIKENRLPIIKYNPLNVKENTQVLNDNKTKNKFKIERLGNNKLKLKKII